MQQATFSVKGNHCLSSLEYGVLMLSVAKLMSAVLLTSKTSGTSGSLAFL